MDEQTALPDPVPEIVDLMLRGLLEPLPWWSLNKKKLRETRAKFVQEVSKAYRNEYIALRKSEDLDATLHGIAQIVTQLTVLISQLELVYRSQTNNNLVQ